MSFLSKGRSIAVVQEVSYAAPAPTFADSDYIDYTKGDMSTAIEKIDRAVIRNSMLKLESVFGQETASGSIDVEISAAVAGALNGDKLYTNGIGRKIVGAIATTATTGTVSQVTVADAAGINVGQILRVNLAVGVDEYVAVTAVTGLVIDVTPNFSQAPTNGDSVQAVLTYVLPKPNDAVPSLAVRENLKPQSGSPIDYEYLGIMVSDVSLTYPVGGIATSSFSLAGAGFTINASGTTPVLPCTIATPIVGKNAVVKVGAINYTAQDVSLKIGSEVTDIKAITTDGLTNKLAVGKTVTGSFKVEYTGIDTFNSFKAGTKAALSLLLRDGGKTSPIIHGVIAPVIKFTNVSRSEDGMVIYDNIEFEVLSPDCGTVERAISVFFV